MKTLGKIKPMVSKNGNEYLQVTFEGKIYSAFKSKFDDGWYIPEQEPFIPVKKEKFDAHKEPLPSTAPAKRWEAPKVEDDVPLTWDDPKLNDESVPF